MNRRLVLVGGSAGSGKSTLAQALADDLGGGWLQLDTVWIALRAAADPDSPTYHLLNVPERVASAECSDAQVLAAHIEASQAICRVLREVIAFEQETHPVLVADGAWLLPSFVAGLTLPDTAVHCAFLEHADAKGVAAALAPRLAGRPLSWRHLLANRRICQYGVWVCDQARSHGLPVVDCLPFQTLHARCRAALGL